MTETVQTLEFTFDAMRGGFKLRFGPFNRHPQGSVKPIFDDLMVVSRVSAGGLAAIESDWGYGGLPLRAIHGRLDHPSGRYSLTGDELHNGAFLLRQTPATLEIWFSGTGDKLPRAHWTRRVDAETGVVVWFSSRTARVRRSSGEWREVPMLAGITVAFDRTIAGHPLGRLCLVHDDLK